MDHGNCLKHASHFVTLVGLCLLGRQSFNSLHKNVIQEVTVNFYHIQGSLGISNTETNLKLWFI